MLAALLIAAQAMLGLTPAQLGLPTRMWCQDFVGAAVRSAGQTGGGWSPDAVLRSLVPFEPVPGGVVGVDLFPDNGVTEHVAVVEAVTESAVSVIEGNGADPGHVTRNSYPRAQVTGSGVTAEAHQQYLARLCAQLQEAKPWIDWECQ